VVVVALGAELFRELQMDGDPHPSTLMSDEEFKELFETVFAAGSNWIRSQKAKPVYFSSIDAAGRFGPHRNMKGGPEICKEIGQNKLISAYGFKARSRFSVRGPQPSSTAMTRPLLQVLTPPLMKFLVPRACAKKSNDPLKPWFLDFANKYKLWYLGWQGAVPVFHNATGELVAAFATSGATGDQDEGAIDIGLAAAGLKRVGARWLWSSREEVAAESDRLFDIKERKMKAGKDMPLIGVGGPFTDTRVGNLVDWGLVDEIGGALSVMVTMRMDELNLWARVFDFSPRPDYDSITVGNNQLGFDMYFAIRRGPEQAVVVVQDFFKLGEEVTALFSVNEDGHMKVWADGELVGEHPAGHTPRFVPRSHLTIAGHHAYGEQGFKGMVEHVKVWNREVSWEVAANTEPKPLRYAYLHQEAAKPKPKPKPKPKAQVKPSKPAAKQAAGKGRG
jgi:hypothetical protein